MPIIKLLIYKARTDNAVNRIISIRRIQKIMTQIEKSH